MGVAALQFRAQPVQRGTALLAYGFGLRHAFDADHIAAIDNATRKLMQHGKQPVAVRLFFAMEGSFDRFRAVAMSSLPASPLCFCSPSQPPI